jgi:hypothetical protein
MMTYTEPKKKHVVLDRLYVLVIYAEVLALIDLNWLCPDSFQKPH